MNLNNICQIFIPILGGLAIYLISRVDKYHKWGYILGLISQPFWLYTTYINEQWGIFVLSIWYTYSWCNGIYLRFIKEGE